MHIKIHDSSAAQVASVGQGDSSITEIYGKCDEVIETLSALGLTVAPAFGVEINISSGATLGEARGGAVDNREDNITRKPRLEYIIGNADVPDGRVTSTARRGVKWFNAVHVGDEVDLVLHETGEVFGRAVIVAKEYVTYSDVLNNADHNHVAYTKSNGTSAHTRAVLWVSLYAAYGSLQPDERFTILHILPINTQAAA